MAIIEPPPNKQENFSYIWKNWLYNLWAFIKSHTGGTSLGGSGTGSNWNAHGDTALGDATSPLKIENAAFYMEGTTPTSPVGDTPTSGAGTRFMFIPSKSGAIRAGKVTSTQWDDANIGDGSIALGNNVIASSVNNVTLGRLCTSSAAACVSIGRSNESSGSGCVSIGDANTASAIAGSWAIGIGNYATGQQAIAIGGANDASANFATAIGSACEGSGGTSPTAIGFNATAQGAQAIAIGTYVSATADNAITIGTGVNNANRLINSTANTMWLGVNTDTPTFIMRNNTGGVNTTANIGIIATDPKSTLEVAGSTGYKYTIISTGTSHTVGAGEEELIFIITSTDSPPAVFSFYLPAIANIDRRMYYIRNGTGTGAGSRDVHVIPNQAAGDEIDNAAYVPVTSHHVLQPGESMQIVADATSTPDRWWII